MKTSPSSHAALAGLLAALALLAVLPGCNGDSKRSITAAAVHPDVLLLDRLGQPLLAGSGEPFSPRQTCGDCHDIDAIANAYHFQQGRTDADGNIVVQDDYFGDGRTFLRSAGMYGKW